MEKKLQFVKFLFEQLFKPRQLADRMKDYLEKDPADKDRKIVLVEEKKTGERPIEEVKGLAGGKEHKTDTIDISKEKEVMKAFDDIARKHGIKYGIVKNNPDSSRVSVIFRAKDSKAMEKAFSEFVKERTKTKEKPTMEQARARAKAKVPEGQEKKNVRREMDAR